MIFPDDLIIDITSWDHSDEENTQKATKYLRSLDVQLRMSLAESPLTREAIGEAPGQLLLGIPALTFPAFHPDMVYALLSSGDLFKGDVDYHSAIGLWAWMQGATADQAARLFTDDILTDLGYTDYWDESVASLRAAFDASDIKFRPFWANVNRSGVFMHTINHPNLYAISSFAKAIAVELGASESVWEYPLVRYLTDYCPSAVWPVFPIVGRRLGIPGAWHWRVHERQYLTVADWLNSAYDAYADTDRASVVCHRFLGGLYDEVLGPRLEVIQQGRG